MEPRAGAGAGGCGSRKSNGLKKLSPKLLCSEIQKIHGLRNETTNECQFCNFSEESILGKTFNLITQMQTVVKIQLYLGFQRKNHKTTGFNVFRLEYVRKISLQVFQLNLWCVLTSKSTYYILISLHVPSERNKGVGCGVQMVRRE